MEKGKSPQQRVAQKPAKTKSFCILCRTFYGKHEAQRHVHSMLHHREMETVLGNDLFHECQACEASSMRLNEYAKHISTADHKAKLKTLTSKSVKPRSLYKTLGTEAVKKILERNKTRKKEEKKATKKKKKKLKQIAGQQHTATQQRSTTKDTAGFKQMCTNAQWQDAHQRGGNVVFYQNKENKVFSLQRPPYHGEACFQNRGEGFHYLSGGPSGRTWHQPYAWDGFQSGHNTRYNDNLSVNNRSVGIKMQITQTDILNKTPQNREAPEHITWPGTSQYDYYNMQSTSAANKDFTSDNLPQNGAILFDQCHTRSSGSSQPAQKGSHCSANPVSVNGSATAAPIRDIDVSMMLRQIRRALGVREPCRADREAKKQNKVAGTDKEPSSGASSAQYPVVSCPAPAAHSAVSTSSIATAQLKQTTLKMAEENTQHCKKSSVVADGLSSNKETQGLLKSPVSIRQSTTGKTTLSEPGLNNSHKVRTAHIPKRAQEGDDRRLEQTLSKLSSSDLQEGMKRKKRDSVKGMPRFGRHLTKPPTDRGSSTHPQDNDATLSEGFHWESIPDIPLDPRSTLPSLQTEPTNLGSRTETQTRSQLQDPLEQSDTAKQVGTSCKETGVSVKVEPNLEYNSEGSRENGKRKLNTSLDDGKSDQGPSKKKKKSKSNKDQHQMDQLLAVSLREDELSHSLHDLDKSLIQARNALQAAYTEVQRLLLLKQQFMSEVNSLRAKRIEILQGMQEGYSGTSNLAEKATTSSAGGSSQPRFSPLPSSVANQQLPAPTLTPSSITQPHPTPLALPIKQEIHTLPTANTDAPPVPLNQPVSFFPSDLLTPLLLRPPHLAAAPPAAATRNTLLSSESDSEESTEGNRGKEQEKQKLSGVKISALKNTPAAPLDSNDGSESDDSVEMMEPSNPVVIAIDESDHEDSHEGVSKVLFHPEPPQTAVSVQCSSASTQTSQQHKEERKVKVSATPVKNASASPHELDSAEDEEPSLGAFGNHTGPVHGLQIHDGLLYTCSGDNTARAYSLATRECQAVFTGHTSKINCLLVSSLPNSPARLYTGSSDQTIHCYSVKSKKCLEQLSLPDRVLCLHIAWRILYVGLANGSVASYDLKTLKQLDVFECHGPRGVSCLATAQEGARRVLLVGSYDSTVSVRDAKSGLLLRSLQGHTKTVLCMKVVNDLVFSGSSDTSVHAHNIHTGELVRIYKGHGHAVTSIVILGKVMVTACLDKLVRVYELQSHDRLQVYGGHSDMVMCMAVHKSVIYTGCYDGSVQAVKLNLMKNYRCWWQNCALIFGISEHLVQHLVKDHSNPNLQTVKCRWKSCDKFFATQQAVRQELPEHMQSHVESDSKVQS